MKKFFLIPLMAMLCTVMAWATNVATLSELQAALAAGGEITLTDNINAGTTQLNITKATTIDGQGFCIKGTNTYVFDVQTSANVVIENLVVWAAKTSKAGRGFLIDGRDGHNANNVVMTLNNVTINATYRALDVWYADGVELTINNCTFQNVQGQAVDAKGNPTAAKYDIELTGTNAGDTRGLNYGQLTNSNITINNTTMQGFFYVLNNVTGTDGDVTGTKLVTNNSIYKGRAALNLWGFGGEYEFNDCAVTGINNYGSSQEGFSCFVFNQQNTCHDNLLTINGGTVVSAVFDETGAANPNAYQYLLSFRKGSYNNNVVINNAQYTCTRDITDIKGGITDMIRTNSSITINDGIYSCPNIFYNTYSTAGVTGNFNINGGTFNVSVISPDMTDGDVYSTLNISGGTFNLDMATPVDPSDADNDLIADGYKQVANANGTYSIVPEATEEKVVADGVNDVNWNTAADWATTSQEATVVPDESTSVAIGNGTDPVSVVVADDGAAEVYRVDLNDQVTLTVQDNGVLTVGEGGIVSHENAEVVVEEGGALVLNGLIQGTENIVIEASEENSAVVLINPDVNTYGDEHPVGTFRFTSKSYKNGDKVVHQRFGMPTYNTAVEMKYATTSSAVTYITNWDYENDEWKQEGGNIAWTLVPTTGSLNLVTAGPFTCYDLISNNAKGEEITYEFKGALMGNADANMKFNRGFNPYANSYTAPINIESLLNRLYDEYASAGIDATIYLYKAQANDNYTWSTIGLDDILFEDAEFTEIAPMQAFMLNLSNSTPQEASIDYSANVYDPFIAKLNNPNPAPKRRVAAQQNYMSMSIIDAEGTEYDRVKFMEDARFSDAFDNGFDAVKFMQENVAIYATLDKPMAKVASDYIEGMNIGVKVANSGIYTLNVKHNGLNYALIDTENNNIIDLVAGNTYNFFAEAGQNDTRFQVVKIHNAPTSIDEIENDQVLSTKVMKNGVLYIIKNGVMYNAQGQVVK